MARKILRYLFLFTTTLTLQYPRAAYADEKEAKVYFEKDCLALFSQHPVVQASENETKVEESQGMVRFEKVTVTESRDGAVVDTYIQVRNCRTSEPAERL